MDRETPRSTYLAAGPGTPAEARGFLREALKDQDATTIDLDAASLLTSEVTSNAANHGGEPIRMSVGLEEDGLWVSVLDQGPGFDPDDETTRSSGSGVKLVEALASDWGVERRDEGTEVWFRI